MFTFKAISLKACRKMYNSNVRVMMSYSSVYRTLKQEDKMDVQQKKRIIIVWFEPPPPHPSYKWGGRSKKLGGVIHSSIRN